MQPFRPPSQAEVRTDFRRANLPPDGYVCGSDARSLLYAEGHSVGTSASSHLSTASSRLPHTRYPLPDEPDMVILSEQRTFPTKPHETTDEYYAYLWTIEGARYKKVYFGVWGLLVAVILGILVGYLVSLATRGEYPSDVSSLTDHVVITETLRNVTIAMASKQKYVRWIKLPGDLLIRAMSCLVVPLIFVNVTVGIADICALQKSAVVGWRLVLFFLLTNIVAAGEGILFSAFIPATIFRTAASNSTVQSSVAVPVTMACPGNTSLFLGFNASLNKMTCMAKSPSTSLGFIDVDHVFQRVSNFANKTEAPVEVVFELLNELVTDNIMAAFAQDNALVSIVVFAIPLGIALGMVSSTGKNPVLDIFRQLNSIFLIMIGWVINFVPVAVVFLVASSFILPNDPTFPPELFRVQNFSVAQVALWKNILPLAVVRTNSFFSNFGAAANAVGSLTAIFLAGTLFHALVFLPLLTFVTTRRNPYAYIFKLNKALNFGFGSASSLAALPMTIQAIDATRTVSQQLTRFVVPIGTGIHLDGAAFYLAACTVYLLKAQTAVDDPNFALSPARVAMIFFTSVINSWSCAPIPHGGLLALNAVWVAVASNPDTEFYKIPINFVWIVAMDALLDRFATLTNILSTAIVTRIIAEQVDETYVDELDRGSAGTSNSGDAKELGGSSHLRFVPMSNQSTPQRRPHFAGELRTDFRRQANTTTSPVHRSHGPSPASSAPLQHDSYASSATPPCRTLAMPDGDMAMLSSDRESEEKIVLHDDYYTHLFTVQGSRFKQIYFGISGLLLALVVGVLLAFAVDQATHAATVPVSAVDSLEFTEVLSTLQNVVRSVGTKMIWNDWIKLPGELLIRALSCLVVPLVFVNVTVGIADLVSLHKALLVGWRMALLFLVTSITAGTLGVSLAAAVPASAYSVSSMTFQRSGSWSNKSAAAISLIMACDSDPSVNTTSYLGFAPDGQLACLPSESYVKLVDVNRVYSHARNGAFHGLKKTASQVVFDLANEVVTDNVIGAFVQDTALLCVVVLAIPIGVALAHHPSRRDNPILDFFRQLNSIFLIMIGWIINFVPVAVVFLVASAFIFPDDPTFPTTLPKMPKRSWGTADMDPALVANLRQLLKMVIVRQNSFFDNFGAAATAIGSLIAVFAIGVLVHCYVLLPALTFIATRRNPLSYLLQLKKPLNFGFGSACSLATLPMVIQAIDATQAVSHQLTRFVVPVATGIHMDGAAFYLAAGAVFLLQSQPDGADVELNAGKAVMIVLVAVITSWSVSPVPHAGLVGLTAVWQSVVANAQPANFVWIVAMDVLLDRFATYMNILSNAVVVRIIAEQIDETYPSTRPPVYRGEIRTDFRARPGGASPVAPPVTDFRSSARPLTASPLAPEARTDFRRHNATASPVVGARGPSPASSGRHPSAADSVSSGHSNNMRSVASAQTHPATIPDVPHLEGEVAMLSSENGYDGKPADANDEYYAYLWTIEGARYKKVYFGLPGLVIAIVLGVGLAFGVDQATRMSNLSPEAIDDMPMRDVLTEIAQYQANLETKNMWNDWIKLPGDMLIRALSCLVVPLIFVNVTVGIADLVRLSKAKMVGSRMAVLFITLSILAAIEGVILASIMPKGVYRTKSTSLTVGSTTNNGSIPMTMGCPLSPTTNLTGYVGVTAWGEMACLPAETTLNINDTNAVFQQVSQINATTQGPEQVFFGLMSELVTDNIVGAFVQDSALVSVVMFAIPLGVVLAKISISNHAILDLFRQLNSIFLIMIGWVINFVPVAVLFLVASSFVLPEDPTYTNPLPKVQTFSKAAANATADTVLSPAEQALTLAYRQALHMIIVRQNSFFGNFTAAAQAVGALTAIFAAGAVLHCYIVLPVLGFLTTRRSFFAYVFQIKKALNFGFASSASLAALPMLIQAIDATRTVSQQLVRFVTPVATGIHMDGASFYLAACSVFLMKSQTASEDVTSSDFAVNATNAILVVFASVITSWNVSPIPHGGLVWVTAVWTSVVSDTPPANFVWIVAMDVLLDRFATYMNIMGNAVVVRIIAEQIDETYVDEQDRLDSIDDATPPVVMPVH
ncbi:dicarboxylate/amino acid:cation (Na or H) symporter (DAACS) family protein [Achlya hypogyna]|uniref:Dicarboxylate/amino acid:cation (Na or H) symporter (DAACS) family protein n=1 Tax=Achlya hypogyna TaxID=1202772 RepID=A0A1V9YYY8_ACHHY|nr:dicarboxylate/amino acid:cation (Na or H) symporter (DAACS) family protein [Achlya hypogyna]